MALELACKWNERAKYGNEHGFGRHRRDVPEGPAGLPDAALARTAGPDALRLRKTSALARYGAITG
jgi:hypothetical protein